MKMGCLIIASLGLIRMMEWQLKPLRSYFKREGKHMDYSEWTAQFCGKIKVCPMINFPSSYVMETNFDNQDSLNLKHLSETQNVLLFLRASCEKRCTHCFFGKVSALCSCRKIPKQNILHIPHGSSFLIECMHQQFEKLPKNLTSEFCKLCRKYA